MAGRNMDSYPTSDWDPRFIQRHPGFDPLAPAVSSMTTLARWPNLSHYQASLSAAPIVCNAHGVALKVTLNDHAQHYELRILTDGILATRAECWHDFFQILVWRTFPQSKAMLNAKHAVAAQARLWHQQPSRNSMENACTLFDENGAILVSSEPNLLELTRNFAWRNLFLHHRAQWQQHVQCFVFGHALFEKLLHPYLGLTAHALLLLVAKSFWNLTPTAQIQHVDSLLAANLHQPDTLFGPHALQPLPILGIPGWHADNMQPAFYDNSRYFRPGRTRHPVSVES